MIISAAAKGQSGGKQPLFYTKHFIYCFIPGRILNAKIAEIPARSQKKSGFNTPSIVKVNVTTSNMANNPTGILRSCFLIQSLKGFQIFNCWYLAYAEINL